MKNETNLQFGDKIILFLVVFQIFYCIYYYTSLLENDHYRIELKILTALSGLLIVICLIDLIRFRNIWYLLFLGSLFVSLILLNIHIRKDWNKLNLLYTEISQRKTGFPPFLTKEISEKGSKYVQWVYRNIDSASFTIYYLESSNLKCRSYPNDKGWGYIRDGEISSILFGSRNLTELEKEIKVAKIKAESKGNSSK